MFPDAIDGMAIFNSPAAKQMLIQRYILNGQTLTADNSVHNSFMTELNNMGWPLNCKHTLLSNGTCDGTPTFPNNNNQFLNITGVTGWTYFGDILKSIAMSFGGLTNSSLLVAPNVPVRNWSLIAQFPLSLITTSQGVNLDFGAWAVPASGTSLIFKGNIFIRRKLLWILNSTSYILKCNVNSTSDMLPLDNAPGSKYDISLFGINIDTVRNQLKAKLGNWVNLNVYQPQFCFVPTVSSLAFSNPTQYYRSNICNTIPCQLPSRVSDYYAPTVNQLHVSYTNDNSNWILQRQNANFNCVVICQSNLSITGSALLCTNGVYSVNNPSGTTVTWSALPSGIVSLQPNGSSVTVTKISDGDFSLTATINSSCGTTAVTKSAHAGVATGSLSIGGVADVCAGSIFYLYLTGGTTSGGNGKCYWTSSSAGASIISEQGTAGIYVQAGNDVVPGYQIEVAEYNACGLSAKLGSTGGPIIFCGGGGFNTAGVIKKADSLNVAQETDINSNTNLKLTLYPNPVKDVLKIAVTENELGDIAEILDAKKSLLKTVKLSAYQTSVNVANFSTGVYFIKIKNKNGIKILKFIKE